MSHSFWFRRCRYQFCFVRSNSLYASIQIITTRKTEHDTFQRKIFSKCRLRDKKYSHSKGERGRRRHMGEKRSVESESFLKVFLSKDFVMVP